MNSKYYCPAPWHGGYFTQQGCSVCCVYPVENISPQELMNSSKIQDIKQGLLTGNLDPACAKCVEKEQLGFNSMRLNHVEQAQEYQTIHGNDCEPSILPQSIEVRFTNVCNFKCRMCYPGLSSLIATEALEHRNVINWYPDLDHGLVESGVGTKFFDEIVANSQHLKRLYLTGGEPTVSKAVADYMRILVDLGYAKNITLVFSTNGSVINPLFNDLLPQFNRIQILLSIDAVDKIAEYQRHGTVWPRVAKNIAYYQQLSRQDRKKYSIAIHAVVTAYSVLGIDQLFQYLNDNQLGGSITVCYEDFYKVQALTGPLRQQAIESIQRARNIAVSDHWLKPQISILDSLESFLVSEPEKQDDWQLFVERTQALDQVRNESFESVFGMPLTV